MWATNFNRGLPLHREVCSIAWATLAKQVIKLEPQNKFKAGLSTVSKKVDFRFSKKDVPISILLKKACGHAESHHA